MKVFEKSLNSSARPPQKKKLWPPWPECVVDCSFTGCFMSEPQVVQAVGKSYHRGCFCCSVCQEQLSDTAPFTIDADRRLLCLNDYYRPVISGSTLTAVVGRFQLLARWPGTHSRILSGIQRAAQTVLGVYLKRTCSHITSASSALGVLNDYVLYKSTHSLTHYRSYVCLCLLITTTDPTKTAELINTRLCSVGIEETCISWRAGSLQEKGQSWGHFLARCKV